MAAKFAYDFAVIGGGSAGLAAAREAASLGAKVCVFDYVKPSPQGSKWGLGGTCLNVGCIPKKLMHHAALMGGVIKHDASKFGWKTQTDGIAWDELVDAVFCHIRPISFALRGGLKHSGIDYFNNLAWFNGKENSISYKKGDETLETTAANCLVCVGGRPTFPDIPGAKEIGVSSDDLFALKTPPGRTLVVGASYIALESAGFLHEFGYPTTVMVRSILLRGFDRQCAEKIGRYMRESGVGFVYGATPNSLERTESGAVKVTYTQGGSAVTEEYDTVVFATGRTADTAGLNLDSVGVKVDGSKKLVCDDNDRSSAPWVYGLGDCLAGAPELTPPAIQAGQYLARRLFGGSSQKMDYKYCATTVFTPTEYGAVGYSEEDARKEYGDADIEVYLNEWRPLEAQPAKRERIMMESDDLKEWTDEYSGVDKRLTHPALAKLVCVKSQADKVVGFHYVGPNAGEVTQGFALAVKLGATKKDFDECVGIHPTDAEAFTQLTVTKSSGQNYTASDGCGGGTCGF
eukprot:gene3685-4108_t